MTEGIQTRVRLPYALNTYETAFLIDKIAQKSAK
jgi:hypothetical protein